MLPDMINGFFEAFGAWSIWMHVRAIRKAKSWSGLSPLAVCFFTLWGWWNLFYYPHLGQWLSFAGGIVLVAGNCFWLYYIWRYRHNG